MRKLATLTAAALIWGTASFASSYSDAITQAYVAAGYTNIQVLPQGRDWLVSATFNGQAMQFIVDASSGRSHRSSDDGMWHDVGDDHGHHSAGHDVGDDHGHHSAGHDEGDDHGHHSAGHDEGDDDGHHGAGHDSDDDHGRRGRGGRGGHGGNHD